MLPTIEYRVRPVTRFIVTRYETEAPVSGCSSNAKSTQHGEFENFDVAYHVGYALAKSDHDRLGLPPTDEHVRYPAPTWSAEGIADVRGVAVRSEPVPPPAPPNEDEDYRALPYYMAAAMRRNARAAGDLSTVERLDRLQIAVDA